MLRRVVCGGLGLLVAVGLAGCGNENRGSITPEREGGPPEAIVESFGEDGVIWVACAGDKMYALDLAGNLAGAGFGLQRFDYQKLDDGASSFSSDGASGPMDWNADEILVYTDSEEERTIQYRFGWSLAYEAEGAQPRLDLAVQEAPDDQRALEGETLEFYRLNLTLDEETRREMEDDYVERIRRRWPRPSIDWSMATLRELAQMHLSHRKETDPEGDLSELLMGWRGQTAVVTFIANGLDPSLENRAACAAAVGIPDYTGTPEQDAQLMDALGAGSRPWHTTLQGAEA